MSTSKTAEPRSPHLIFAGFLLFVLAPLGGNALAGSTVLVSGVPFFQESSSASDRVHLVVSGNNLFWSDSGVARVNMIPVTGGPVTTLATKMGVPTNVTIDNGTLYWVETRSGFASSGCVGPTFQKFLKKKAPDGTETVLANGDNCAGGTADIVIDSNNVYWVTSTATPDTYAIEEVPLDGGIPTTVLTTSTPIVAMARDATDLYWEEEFFPEPGSIKKIPLTGGAESILYASASNPLVGDFVVHGGQVYFADMGFPSSPRLLEVPGAGGAATVLADVPENPVKIVADDSNIYWIDPDSLRKLAIPGGEIVTLASSLFSPQGLGVDSQSVYWSDANSPCCTDDTRGSIKKVPISGGLVTVLADDLLQPGSLTLDSANVYWAENGPYAEIEGYGRIAAVPLDGGAAVTVAEGVSSDLAPIAVDDTNVYIADKWTVKKAPISGGTVETLARGDFYIEDIATDGNFVYWIEDPFSIIRKVPVNGGPVVDLAVGSGPAGPLAVDSNNVYWMDGFNTINKVPIGGGPVTSLASGLPFLSDFTIDGTNVYFSENDTGRIRKFSLAGGSIADLADGEPLSWNILAVDDQYLYWVDQGKVGRVPKVGGSATRIAGGLQSDATIANGLTANGTGVYWAEVAGGTIKKATTSSTSALTFSPNKVKLPATIVLGNHGATSAAKMLKLINKTSQKPDADITIGSIVSDDPEFSPVGCVGLLPTGQTCEVSITFTPNAPGTRTGNLIVSSNATNATLMIPLRGVGKAGKIKISPMSLKFGKVPVNTFSASKPITLLNPNPIAMHIDSVTPLDAVQFQASGCAGTDIAAGGTCTVNVTFTPASIGKQRSTLTIADDAAGGSQTVKLKGNGQ